MREIQLTKGYVALVDDEDYESISVYKWYAMVVTRTDGSFSVYAQSKIKKLDGNYITQGLHRIIMNASVGMQVDHINGNPLDNRRTNLRICSHSENQQNQRHKSGGTSKFKGVSWAKNSRKWRAQIRINWKVKCIGEFETEQEAAIAYNAAAFLLHGEFASINVL